MKRVKLALSLLVMLSLLSCSKFSFMSSDKKSEDKPKTDQTGAGEKNSEDKKIEPEKSKELTPTGESINYIDRKIVFGSSASEFLKANSDFKLCADASEYEKIKVYCKLMEETDANGNMINYKTYYSFFNDELFEMNISESGLLKNM